MNRGDVTGEIGEDYDEWVVCIGGRGAGGATMEGVRVKERRTTGERRGWGSYTRCNSQVQVKSRQREDTRGLPLDLDRRQLRVNGSREEKRSTEDGTVRISKSPTPAG